MPKTPKGKKGAKSWSQIDLWDKCRLRFRFQYVDRLKAEVGLPAIFGSAFHEFRFRYYDHLRVDGMDSDWDMAAKIAKKVFKEFNLPLHIRREFLSLAERFAESRPLPKNMNFEVRFGVNGNGKWASFDKANFFRGIADGLEIDGDVGVITDAKTSMSMNLPFTQLEVYAAILSLRYPEVETWKLLYDFVRYGRIKSKEVLAANLGTVREHVKDKVEQIETAKEYPPQPGEHCAYCPFLSICTYGKQISKSIEIPETMDDAGKMAEEYLFVQAVQAQKKRILKKFVEEFGDVVTANAKAAFFPTEKKDVETAALIKYLKGIGINPVDHVSFSSAAIDNLMNNEEISDDVANFVAITSGQAFKIQKPGKGEEVES